MSHQSLSSQRSGLAPRLSTLVGAAAVLGGIAWLLLIPAAELERRGVLSYDGYNRFLAVPLLLFTVALAGAARGLATEARLAKIGLWIATVGAGLLLAGTVVEFYGVLLHDGLNAQAAYEAGAADHWVGSDIGWLIFVFGFLTLLIGGIVAALGLHRAGIGPVWLRAFAAILGLGVLAGNLFGLEPLGLSVPGLGLYAAGWIAVGLLALRADKVLPAAAR